MESEKMLRVDFPPPYDFDEDGNQVKAIIGHCDWCNGIHVKCMNCGTITPVHDSEYNKIQKCEGGCGLEFIIIQNFDKDGIGDEHLEVMSDPIKKKS